MTGKMPADFPELRSESHGKAHLRVKFSRGSLPDSA